MKWVVAATVVAVLGPALAGCGSSDLAARFGGGEYVALGDSFTSGAGLADSGAGTTCQRSASTSYPHVLARRLRMGLTDASCGGSTSENFTSAQAAAPGDAANPPQGLAVRASTDLVTIGWGYNDLGFYGGLMFTCTQLATSAPDGSPCRDAAERDGSDFAASAAVIGDRLEDTLGQVHDRAPDAVVVLVGYPQLVPESGTCSELPLAVGDYAWVRGLFEDLDEELAAAADRAGVTYVDVWRASAGHDICAGADAWTSGADRQSGQVTPYHPLSIGQAAFAELALAALEE